MCLLQHWYVPYGSFQWNMIDLIHNPEVYNITNFQKLLKKYTEYF